MPLQHIPSPVTPLDGEELFIGAGGATVLDFWRYALPDLKTNTTRGLLAEFLVHRAVGALQRNQEWESFDVLAVDGLRIEVKSSAYLQAWSQREVTKIVFDRLRTRTWSPQTGDAAEPSFNADVYVFAVHTATSHEDYDPLDVGQWQFYVVPGPVIEANGTKSLALNSVRALAGDSVPYADLAARIRAADPRATRAGAGGGPGVVERRERAVVSAGWGSVVPPGGVKAGEGASGAPRAPSRTRAEE
ncbi:hypothetical protein V7793_10945 [Streptomyces sp. KLMMK]|uniref:hypothetical protein n=1 Tax=Streptomyces sp. KLMMK TaxID=3109353 RepID=UPI00300A3AFF